MYSFPMSKKTSGTVVAVSANKAALAVSNDEGWTVVELIGSEGEIGVGDVVLGDWKAVGSEDLIFNGQKFRAIFQGTGTKQWALGQIAQWGRS
jgi:hypothetical protein